MQSVRKVRPSFSGDKQQKAYGIFEFGVFLLGVDQVEDDVEGASKNEGEEEAEARQVDIALSTADGVTVSCHLTFGYCRAG